jgi:outer membrane receptor for ferrienterochelin and colicin
VFLRFVLAAVCLTALPAPAFATIFGTVKGVVIDPQQQPVAGVTITIHARHADWSRTTTSDAHGEFQFPVVPIGEYAVSATSQGFAPLTQDVTVVSGAASTLRLSLALATRSQSVTVSATTERVAVDSATPTTLVSRGDIAGTPGADRTNSLAMITDFVPGSYLTHDQLHVRGGHQVSWLIDGVPIPNTNIASNVGPQVDPKDIDYLEVQRGSYQGEYGDRTYGVFNVVPRTGFERTREAEVTASAGAFGQTNDGFSVGSHSSRWAYYASANVNRSSLGLETPSASILHDGQTGIGGFTSLIFNADASNQLRVVASVRRDRYQIPNAPDAQAAGIDDSQREADGLVNATWVHTFNPHVVTTVSPFYHYNLANYDGGPQDFPTSTVDDRTSTYVGTHATVTAAVGRSSFSAGVYGFHQQDDQRFGLTFNDHSQANISTREQPAGNVVAVFAQEKLEVTDWLTLTGGMRHTHFTGGIQEDATSPRVGIALRIPAVGWVVRGFWGRFYQSPPLVTASGPLLAFVTSATLGFIPLRGERDTEYQAGVTLPVAGWTLDSDIFRTHARNFFDHNNVGNSNIFFPLTIDAAVITGWETTVRSPHAWSRGDVHLAYSLQKAEGQGAITGGLTDFEDAGGSFLLDHDQRHTLSLGAAAIFSRGITAGGNVSYGSGFTDAGGPAHLPGHMTVDLRLEKAFGTRVSASVNALNIANRHLLIDNSLTFGGTHFNAPREIYAQIRYRFRY